MHSLTSNDPWDDHPADYARQVAVLALDLPADHPVRRILGAGDIPATLVVDVLDTVREDAADYAARTFDGPGEQAKADLWASAMREAICVVYNTFAAALTVTPTGGAA